jgi:hypothetical protein
MSNNYEHQEFVLLLVRSAMWRGDASEQIAEELRRPGECEPRARLKVKTPFARGHVGKCEARGTKLEVQAAGALDRGLVTDTKVAHLIVCAMCKVALVDNVMFKAALGR